MCPYRVAVDGEGNILVADSDNHRIQKFTAKGQFLTAVGTKGSGPLQFDKVDDIAINTSNNKVYSLLWSNIKVPTGVVNPVQLTTTRVILISPRKWSGLGQYQYQSFYSRNS